MQYPQPSEFEWSNAGKTLYQKMPWAPGITRTPEQISSDTADGIEWRDDVLITGARNQIYGQQLDGWLYAGPDGNPWHIDAIPFEGSIGTSFNEIVTVSLFGRVGVPAEKYDVTVTLADTGQSAPSLTASPQAEVLDITPDGSKAVIMIWSRTDRPPFTTVALDKMSLGFLLLELSGTPGVDFVASLSVLRTRDQTLGLSHDTGNPAIVQVTYYTDLGETTEEVIVGGADCSGYREIKVTPSAYPTSGTGASFSVGTVSGQRVRGVSDRIVGMWFDASGTPQDVTLSFSATYTIDSPGLTQSASGQYVRREYHTGGTSGFCEYGPAELISSYTRTYSRFVQRSIDVSIKLQHLGDSVEWLMGRDETSDYSYARSSAEAFTEAWETSEVVDSGFGSYSRSSNNDWNFQSSQRDGDAPIGFTPDERLRLSEPFFLGIFVNGDFVNNRIGWMRYSNNAIGIYQITDTDGAAATWRQGPVIHPAGKDSQVYANPSLQRYGSFNPSSAELVRNEPQPVCWV